MFKSKVGRERWEKNQKFSFLPEAKSSFFVSYMLNALQNRTIDSMVWIYIRLKKIVSKQVKLDTEEGKEKNLKTEISMLHPRQKDKWSWRADT